MEKTKTILVLYGGGGLSSEVFELAKVINRWDEILFVDDAVSEYHKDTIKLEDLTERVSKFVSDKYEFIISVGEPKLRKLLYGKISAIKNITPTTLIHPSAFIATNSEILPGAIVNFNCFVSANVKIDKNVYLQPISSIGHNTEIKAHSVISTFSSIAGNCSVGECAYVGMNATLIQESTIGDNTIVGMGSVVMKSFESNLTLLGNPARIISNNENNKVFK